MRLGIGDPYKLYLWIMDTWSELTWTQCKNCFLQREIFEPLNSTSYRAINCDSPFCKEFNPATSEGHYASETFTFETGEGHFITVPGAATRTEFHSMLGQPDWWGSVVPRWCL
ncbi:hypothetical protein AMTR_s00057p00163910 [Amborella trichopoda]|uniref:Peptidase A1 domain-containing protein n=1 Tax=Amborella trichopoda TaxID=13333 RepID=U5D388_AMBTC|nr:hypothetical protein AMTR_s00057p00163910 [Amborella trichopoda]